MAMGRKKGLFVRDSKRTAFLEVVVARSSENSEMNWKDQLILLCFPGLLYRKALKLWDLLVVSFEMTVRSLLQL